MAASPHFEFVSDLAAAFNEGAISLPSFPDIVVRIRRTLEKDDVHIDKVVRVVKTDPVLVSRLLVFANSAAYNPAGHRIESVDVAVSRLGFDLVKSTAISLALRQAFLAEQHRDIAPMLRAVWQESMQLSAMASAIVDGRRSFDNESAFMSGLLHYVGKVYIMTRAKDYPGFATDSVMLEEVIREWHPKIGASVVESWGFPEDIVRTVDTGENVNDYTSMAPELVDVVAAAEVLLQRVGEAVRSGRDPSSVDAGDPALEHPSMARLGISGSDLPLLYGGFQERLSIVREALTG